MNLDTHTTFHPSELWPLDFRVARTTNSSLVIRESLCLQQFSGDIDLGTLADLTAALDRILGQRPACVVLDMGGVDFVSVSGVGVIGRFVADAAAQQMPVSVVCERGLARTLRLCRLDPIVEAYATLEEAVEALQPHLLH